MTASSKGGPMVGQRDSRKSAGPTELRLLTERLRVAADRLGRRRDAHDEG
jgi:hypothetical protein